jgi:predicted transport protein
LVLSTFDLNQLTVNLLASDGNLYPFTYNLSKVVNGDVLASATTNMLIKRKSKQSPTSIRFNDVAVWNARAKINEKLNTLRRELTKKYIELKQQKNIQDYTHEQKQLYLKLLEFEQLSEKAKVEYASTYFKNSGINLDSSNDYQVSINGYTQTWKHGNHQEVSVAKFDWHNMTTHNIHGYSN